MKQLAQLDCEGFAIGGLAVGEPAPVMYDIIEHVEPYMPKDKPRYLMGVGTPVNILEGVARGVDFFDCVMPSRNARHGHLNTWNGVINLNNARYARDDGPIDAQCDCPVCRRYSCLLYTSQAVAPRDAQPSSKGKASGKGRKLIDSREPAGQGEPAREGDSAGRGKKPSLLDPLFEEEPQDEVREKGAPRPHPLDEQPGKGPVKALLKRAKACLLYTSRCV